MSGEELAEQTARRELDAAWRDPSGLWGFLITVDHKRIAARYIVTTMFLLFLAGMLAMDMRLQLPLFLWAMLVASLMTIFALPAVMLATSMLIADRLVATRFFSPSGGGDVLRLRVEQTYQMMEAVREHQDQVPQRLSSVTCQPA